MSYAFVGACGFVDMFLFARRGRQLGSLFARNVWKIKSKNYLQFLLLIIEISYKIKTTERK